MATEDTRLIYMTTGVLLQKVVSAKSLVAFTHIFIDEVHALPRCAPLRLSSRLTELVRRPDACAGGLMPVRGGCGPAQSPGAAGSDGNCHGEAEGPAHLMEERPLGLP